MDMPQHALQIAEIVRRYPDQWVLVEKMAWDAHAQPTAGRPLSPHVKVEIGRADELERRRGLHSARDAMWSSVGKQANQRWHARDHHTGKGLASVFGRRQEVVFLQQCRVVYLQHAANSRRLKTG
jgi:hypothetical protein